jgi:hypothetical protein
LEDAEQKRRLNAKKVEVDAWHRRLPMSVLVVELAGPDFFKEALTVARNLKLRSVRELRVLLGNTSPKSPNVKAAVTSLKGYLHPSAAVFFITAASGHAAPSTPSRQTANPYSAFGGILIHLLKSEMILLQEKTRIMEIVEETTLSRARAQDNAYMNMDAYIRG